MDDLESIKCQVCGKPVEPAIELYSGTGPWFNERRGHKKCVDEWMARNNEKWRLEMELVDGLAVHEPLPQPVIQEVGR